MRPWLWIPPQFSHDISPYFMNLIGRLPRRPIPEWKAFTWRGMRFPNRLGLAGGVDKDAIGMRGWWQAGAGFLEIGTVTPRPQPGHQGHRIARNGKRRAVWNRLGFPSQGAESVLRRVRELPSHPAPLFVNIGKNAATSLDAAHDDYLHLISKFAQIVDGFVVNISSPNTKDLRDLLRPDRLAGFLTPLSQKFRQTGSHWLLKISPDIEATELETILAISMTAGCGGWVLTNTSQGLRDGLSFPAEGGVSGLPLAERSKALLKSTVAILGSKRQDRLIVSVGGIMTAEDVEERLALGADLVEVYAALIFSGPMFFEQVAKWQLKRK